MTYIRGNREEKAIKKFSINVNMLCDKICELAKWCYEEEYKFNFFNYILINADFRTKNIFLLKKE